MRQAGNYRREVALDFFVKTYSNHFVPQSLDESRDPWLINFDLELRNGRTEIEVSCEIYFDGDSDVKVRQENSTIGSDKFYTFLNNISINLPCVDLELLMHLWYI